MCGFHIFGRARDGDVEIEVVGEDGAGDEDDEDAEGGVFKVGDLDLHAAEFDAPAYVGVRWGRFESHVLPVGGLEVFKMVCAFGVEGFEIFGEDDKRVADEEMGEMGGEKVVHAAVQKLLFELLVDDQVWIHVLRAKTWILGDVSTIGGVSRLWYTPTIVLQRFLS